MCIFIEIGAVKVSTGVIWQLSAAEIESISRDKRLTNSNGDESLDGLVIDWHLAEFDYPAMNAPIGDYQPSYSAYAAWGTELFNTRS